eukprot:TRINITY_DN2967_c0_g3_i1.p1 TRINITY_DN2967_c0_g3~~TRINITY_DN2967_c0_g3_i1.p1  ORF type:complete len:464 (+),score=43.01 TRINITY_DN2967_c0_g3_i1:129-1520(+)
MVDYAGLLLAAVKSVTSAIGLFAWAAGLGWAGFVDQKFISQLARVTKVMFLPGIAFHSIASGMSVPFIRENWPLSIMGIVIVVVGWLTGGFLASIVNVPSRLRPWFVLSVCYPNMIALPLVLTEAICHEQESTNGGIAQCVENGTVRLFTVTLSHTLIFWIFAYGYASSHVNSLNAAAASAASHDETAALKAAADTSDISPDGSPTATEGSSHTPTKATTIGSGEHSAQCLSLPVLDASKEMDQLETGGAKGQDVRSIAIADANVAKTATDNKTEMTPLQILWRQCQLAICNPPVMANILAMLVGFIPAAQRLLYSKGAPLSFMASAIAIVAKASPAVTNLIAGGTFGLQLLNLSRDDPLGLKVLGMSRMAMLLLVVGRIVIAPLLNFFILVLVLDYLPKDPWSRLVLFFQPAGTTANVITVLAQLLDQPDAAKLVALAAIPQMLLYIPVSTGFVAVGMAWTA